MTNKGFSHIGLATRDLDGTHAFYEGVLGFKAVVADTLNIREGGRLRHIFFDVGRDQLLAFMEARNVPGVPEGYDAGINRGLGVPAAFYHFAFEAGSEAALAERRDKLRAKDLEVSDIVDHGQIDLLPRSQWSFARIFLPDARPPRRRRRHAGARHDPARGAQSRPGGIRRSLACAVAAQQGRYSLGGAIGRREVRVVRPLLAAGHRLLDVVEP